MEVRAAALERVGLSEYNCTAHELRRFAAMLRAAGQYLRQQPKA